MSNSSVPKACMEGRAVKRKRNEADEDEDEDWLVS
jgi:hypothetical protein